MNATNSIDIYGMPSVSLARSALEYLEQEDISIDVIRNYKREMLRRRFNYPLSFLINSQLKKIKSDDLEPSEAADRRKQIKIFKEIASLKKLSLNMLRLAEYYLRLREGLMGHELTDYLPKKGRYFDELILLRFGSSMVFRELESILSSFGEASVVEKVLVEEAGRTYISDKEYALSMGLDVKRVVRRARVLPLVRSPLVRKILITASLKRANTINLEENDGELIEYNSILMEHGVSPYSRVDVLKGKEELKRTLHLRGFGKLDGENFSTDEQILEKINLRRAQIKRNITKESASILGDVLKKALSRELQIPTMAKNPTPLQLKALHLLEKIAKDG